MQRPYWSSACVVFGLGSLIVKFVDVGSSPSHSGACWSPPLYSSCSGVFSDKKMPTKRKTVGYAILSGVFLAFDLALWHESIHAVGPGISTLLNSLQIFFLAAIGFFFYSERLSTLQILSLILATIGVALIGSPEFSHNDNAAWGFVSGVLSGAMLALSMVFVRKTHEQEKSRFVSTDDDFKLRRRNSAGHPIAAIRYRPSLPQNFKRCDSSLHLRHRHAMFCLGIDCLRHPAFILVTNRPTTALRTSCCHVDRLFLAG